MSQKKKLTYAQKMCVALTGKLMQEIDMVPANARIGIAASGGVDSWVMLKVLTIRKAIMPFPVELMVIHLNPGFDTTNHSPLVEWCKENGVASHIETTDYGLRGHSDENRTKSPCFFCSMLRRKRLFDICRQYKLTSLALGHNADDLATTFFMNMFQAGRVYGMTPKESFFNNTLDLIRPTLFLEKSTVIKAAKQWELPVWQNDCPSGSNTARSRTHDWLEDRFKENKKFKANVFASIKRFQLEELAKAEKTIMRAQKHANKLQ